MVPDNESTPKPHQPPSSSASAAAAAQFHYQLFPPLVTGINPSPNPNPFSQPQPPPPPPPPPPNSNYPHLLPHSDLSSNFPQFPINNPFSDCPQPRDSDAAASASCMFPRWVDQHNPIRSLAAEIGVSDYDIDIGSLVAHFLNVPDDDARGCLGGGSSSGTKRGTVDFLGIGLPINDNATTPKRTKTDELHDENVNLGFDFLDALVSPTEEEQGDRRGKRKLDDQDAADGGGGGVGEGVVAVDGLNGGGGDGLRRFSREEKMKGPVFEIDFLSDAFREDAFRAPKPPESSNIDLDMEPSDCDDDDEYDDVPQPHHQPPIEVGSRRRERFRDIAKENASRFARFVPDAKDDAASSSTPEPPPVEPEVDEGPTPFSTAMNLMKEKAVKNKQTKPSWVPKRNGQDMGPRVLVPSLKELCLKILASNADAIVSLDGVPDDLRHRLSQLLCDSRRMNSHFFELLVRGSPTEVRLRDCSWLSEEQFTESFTKCDPANLVVLQLDQCGRCLPDYILEQSPRWLNLTRLASLSLSGACRLSDKGLRMLVSSAPALRSINLSQCSLLTSASINILAGSLGSLLKELYLDDCQNIHAALIVSALKQLEHLEVLSLAGIQTVCDKFINDYIVACGHNMKELVLKDCIKLTDVSMKVIAEHCPGLCVLDLTNLCKLTDLSIGYLANRCRALHTLMLCRSPFSDEAIAAFIEITGESLKELSLNNIKKVGHFTTSSLANHAKNLHTLDLSWCRNLTDNELGLIVDSCRSLRLLKLFGCTQITDVFLNGYSNPEIQIIGLKMSPLFQHVKMPDPNQGALRYSPVSVN